MLLPPLKSRSQSPIQQPYPNSDDFTAVGSDVRAAAPSATAATAAAPAATAATAAAAAAPAAAPASAPVGAPASEAEGCCAQLQQDGDQTPLNLEPVLNANVELFFDKLVLYLYRSKQDLFSLPTFMNRECIVGFESVKENLKNTLGSSPHEAKQALKNWYAATTTKPRRPSKTSKKNQEITNLLAFVSYICENSMYSSATATIPKVAPGKVEATISSSYIGGGPGTVWGLGGHEPKVGDTTDGHGVDLESKLDNKQNEKKSDNEEKADEDDEEEAAPLLAEAKSDFTCTNLVQNAASSAPAVAAAAQAVEAAAQAVEAAAPPLAEAKSDFTCTNLVQNAASAAPAVAAAAPAVAAAAQAVEAAAPTLAEAKADFTCTNLAQNAAVTVAAAAPADAKSDLTCTNLVQHAAPAAPPTPPAAYAKSDLTCTSLAQQLEAPGPIPLTSPSPATSPSLQPLANPTSAPDVLTLAASTPTCKNYETLRSALHPTDSWARYKRVHQWVPPKYLNDREYKKEFEKAVDCFKGLFSKRYGRILELLQNLRSEGCGPTDKATLQWSSLDDSHFIDCLLNDTDRKLVASKKKIALCTDEQSDECKDAAPFHAYVFSQLIKGLVYWHDFVMSGMERKRRKSGPNAEEAMKKKLKKKKLKDRLDRGTNTEIWTLPHEVVL